MRLRAAAPAPLAGASATARDDGISKTAIGNPPDIDGKITPIHYLDNF
jgi:hypothetical protein